MTRIQRTALALGALVLLAVGAAAVFVATFDAARYKPLAIDWMRNEKQRTLAIDGPIELSLLPRLAVKVSRLRLSERGRPNDEFAAVDEASLSLQLLPLLRKQLVVDRVAARGVRAVISRDAQGRRNIDDLLSREPASAAPAAGAGSSPAMRLDIGSVRIDDARIVLRDATVPLEGTVTLASFASGRLAPGVSTALSLKAALNLTRPQALQLALDGAGDLLFDAAKGSASLNAAKLRVTGDTAAVKALDATLEGALAWDGGTLDAGPLLVAVAGAKVGGVTLAASRLDARRLVYSSATQRLELEALKLALAGRRGSDAFELALDWPRLAATGERLQGSGLAGRFKLGGSQALTGRFESGAPGGSFDAVRLPGFALKVDGSIGARKIDAELKSNLLLRPGKGAASLDRLALRARLDEPGLQPLQLSLDGQAGVDAKGAQWALQGALNTNRLESNGNVAFGGKVPNLQASARFDRLDLNQLLAPNQPAAATAAAPADTPVQLDGLTALNGRFNLAAGQLMFRQYRLADARLDAALDDGTLRVQRLAGGAWGGGVEASGSAQARSQRIAIRLAASGVNVNALLKDVAGKDLLEGTGRVNADLTTSGASLGALRANLAGNAALQLRDGAIKGVNLARAMRQAKAAVTLQRDAITKAQAAEKTDFSELTATARIASGVAESDDLDVKSPFLRIGGAGRFDIGRGRIDYTARATVIGAPAGQDGAELAALKGVTVPVHLSGPFEAIDWKIQWSGVAAAAVQSKLKDKLAEKLGATLGAPKAASAPASAPDRPKDKLKERLRGLFGQ
jgi:AsmA protein